jgi:hypothetical protein
VLSGGASRRSSVTDSFDRESFNSVEQTFTVGMVSFMVAHTKEAKVAESRMKSNAVVGGLCALGVKYSSFE